MEKRTHPLEALTHFDGRNARKLAHLRQYFSELSWMRYRLRVMVGYLVYLVSHKIVPITTRYELDSIWQTFTLKDGETVETIETNTKHDLRSLEVYLKLKLTKEPRLAALVNFGIGSEDINNVALRLILRDVLYNEIIPQLVGLTIALINNAKKFVDQPLLARTHGQPASVTTLGKEIAVFLDRLVNEIAELLKLQFRPKFSGEVGTYASPSLTLPNVDWLKVEKNFLETFGFKNPAPATQIPPYDDFSKLFDNLRRSNQILVACCKDLWMYTSFGYITFDQPLTEVGSAGMPHKINPQYLEGAEGGLELANSLFEFMGRKLSYSRLQRDFSDSTVRRNMVLPISYCILSYESMMLAFKRLKVNDMRMRQDIELHWEVLSDAMTTYLKYRGINEAYEMVRQQSNGKTFTKPEWLALLKQLEIDPVTLAYLQEIKLVDLTVHCERLVRNTLDRAKDVLDAVTAAQKKQPF